MADYVNINSCAAEYLMLYPTQQGEQCDKHYTQLEERINHSYVEIAELPVYRSMRNDESRQHEIEDSIVGGLMLIKAYMRKNESFNPTASLMANVGHPNVDRNRWSQMAQVKASGYLVQLSFQSQRVQEALFHCIMEQVSYVKGLDLVIQYFVNSPKVMGATSKRIHQIMFSDFVEMQKLGRALMEMLCRMWQHSCLLSPSLMMFGMKHFLIHNSYTYKTYAYNYGHRLRMLISERRNNQEFDDTLSEIQRDPALRQINLETVLFLPAVRLDFIKSDVLGVLAALPKVGPDYAPVSSCFEELNRMTSNSLEDFKQEVQLVRTLAIEDYFRFPKLKQIPVKTGNGILVKEGLLLCDMLMIDKIVSKEKVKLYVIVYENTVFVTKNYSKTDFEVIAYESRKKIRIKMIDKTQKITFAPKHGKWVFYFNCNSGKEQGEWNKAIQLGRSCKCYLCEQK